jgi:hypothetical protein
VGSFIRRIVAARTRAGILSFAGQVEGVKTAIIDFFYRGYAGTLTLTGSLSSVKNAADKSVSGALGLLGRITTMDIRLSRLSGASITPSGIVMWIAVTSSSAYRGTLTMLGSISRRASRFKAKSGTLTLAGSVTGTTGGIWNYFASGIITLAGSTSRLLAGIRIFSGVLTAAGLITRLLSLARSKAGVLSFSGSVAGLYTSRDILLGYLNLSGTVTRIINALDLVTLSSSLSMSGALTVQHGFKRVKRGTLSFAGEQEAYKDALHYGPEVY